MKLLLTSAGITNDSLKNTLLEMVGKQFSQVKLAYIPTAANIEPGDKWWLLDDIENFRKLGLESLDIVDISALPQKIWRRRIENVDIIVVGGGNTFYLMYWIKKSGFGWILPELLKSKVYIGISAGSCVISPSIELSTSDRLYDEEQGEYKGNKGLGFVDFHIRPHLNSKYFPQVNKKNLEEIAKEVKEPIYGLDDNSAIEVIDGEGKVISEGEWFKFN